MVQAVKQMAIGRLPGICVQLAVGLLLAACQSPAALQTPETPDLVYRAVIPARGRPAPRRIVPDVCRRSGWSDGSPEGDRIAHYFVDLVRQTRGWTWRSESGRGPASAAGISFLRSMDPGELPEAYSC